MKLPFTEQQFLEVFGQYNQTFFIGIAALWLATLFVVVLWLRDKPLGARWISVMLCVHWACVGIFYHFLYFARINSAARLFAIFFVVQAVGFGWYAGRPDGLKYDGKRSSWYPLSVGLILYSLAYPILVMLAGFKFPHMPAFAVPCPSTILTAGFLLAANPSAHRLLIIIPIAWAVIGSSAAILFRVYPDMVLPIAAIFLTVAAFKARQRR